MIIFNEGLPRSGKSLNAIKEWLVPMLSKGRKVFAYVEGLNHEQIATLAGITLDECTRLLVPLLRDQVKDWYNHVENDAFVILDEIQNFYPKSRKPLTEEQTTAIAEHGHRGLDILLMGQVFGDVHTTWTNRVAQRILFMKREAIGKADEFSMTIFKPVKKGDKLAWQEVRTIKGQAYDKSYFGAYKSHTDETENKETLIDKNANIWNNPLVSRYLPAFGVVCIISLGYIIYMFNGGLATSIATDKSVMQDTKTTELERIKNEQLRLNTAQNSSPVAQNSQVQPIPPQTTQAPPTPLKTAEQEMDKIEQWNKSSTPYLKGYLRSKNRTMGVIEWVANDNKIIQSVSFENLKAMGYIVLLDTDNNIAIITNGTKQHIVTTQPILPDNDGQVTNARLTTIANQSSNSM